MMAPISADELVAAVLVALVVIAVWRQILVLLLAVTIALFFIGCQDIYLSLAH